MKLHLDMEKLAPSILAGAGFVIFMLLYATVNLVVVNTLHSNACNTTMLEGREAMLLTSPLSVCEVLSPVYKNVMGGLFSNGEIVGIIIFISIIYSIKFGKRFKRYLCFRDTVIIAVVSSYVLSLWHFLGGKISGGTSIIAVDLLLYLLLASIFGAIVIVKERKTGKVSFGRLYFLYLAPIVLIPAFIIPGYLLVKNPWPHIEGMALLFGYLLIRIAILRHKNTKPDRNKK